MRLARPTMSSVPMTALRAPPRAPRERAAGSGEEAARRIGREEAPAQGAEALREQVVENEPERDERHEGPEGEHHPGELVLAAAAPRDGREPRGGDGGRAHAAIPFGTARCARSARLT